MPAQTDDTPASYKSDLLSALIGIVARIIVFVVFGESLASKPELSTKQNSVEKLEDGIAMLRDGLSPYDGDDFHIHPLLLHLAAFGSSRICTFAFLTLCDLISSFLLWKSAARFAPKSASVDPNMRSIVLKCFILNPVTIASCSACSLTSINNLFLAVLVYGFAQGSWLTCSFAVAFSIYLDLYPALLIPSIFLRFSSSYYARILAVVGATVTGILAVNVALNNGSLNFLDDVYLSVIRIDDLTPNCGLFWYFYTQVFDVFRTIFLFIFFSILLVCCAGLLVAFRNEPYLHLVMSMLILSISSPYPTMNFASIYLALLPTFARYWKLPTRFLLPMSCTLATCTVLLPVTWHMWIVNGSGNANFYFGATVAYTVAQIGLLVDLIFCYSRFVLQLMAGTASSENLKIAFHAVRF